MRRLYLLLSLSIILVLGGIGSYTLIYAYNYQQSTGAYHETTDIAIWRGEDAYEYKFIYDGFHVGYNKDMGYIIYDYSFMSNFENYYLDGVFTVPSEVVHPVEGIVEITGIGALVKASNPQHTISLPIRSLITRINLPDSIIYGADRSLFSGFPNLEIIDINNMNKYVLTYNCGYEEDDTFHNNPINQSYEPYNILGGLDNSGITITGSENSRLPVIFSDNSNIDELDFPNGGGTGNIGAFKSLYYPNADIGFFEGLESLVRVNMPYKTTVTSREFARCSNLSELVLSPNVSIYHEGIKGTKVAEIDAGSIYDGGLSGATHLEEVSVTYLRNFGALEGSYNIDTVTFEAPYGVTQEYTLNLSELYNENNDLYQIGVRYINLPENTEVADDAFNFSEYNMNSSLHTINMENVTRIGERAFMGNDNLAYVNSDVVTHIESEAFKGCSNLYNVCGITATDTPEVPFNDKLVYIDISAFEDSNVEVINIPVDYHYDWYIVKENSEGYEIETTKIPFSDYGVIVDDLVAEKTGDVAKISLQRGKADYEARIEAIEFIEYTGELKVGEIITVDFEGMALTDEVDVSWEYGEAGSPSMRIPYTAGGEVLRLVFECDGYEAGTLARDAYVTRDTVQRLDFSSSVTVLSPTVKSSSFGHVELTPSDYGSYEYEYGYLKPNETLSDLSFTDDNYFTALSADTNYRFYQRVKRTKKYKASDYEMISFITPSIPANAYKTFLSFNRNDVVFKTKADSIPFYPGDYVEIPYFEVASYSENTYYGWNTEADGSGTIFYPGEYIQLTDELTLYADRYPLPDESEWDFDVITTAAGTGNKYTYNGSRDMDILNMHNMDLSRPDEFRITYFELNEDIKVDTLVFPGNQSKAYVFKAQTWDYANVNNLIIPKADDFIAISYIGFTHSNFDSLTIGEGLYDLNETSYGAFHGAIIGDLNLPSTLSYVDINTFINFQQWGGRIYDNSAKIYGVNVPNENAFFKTVNGVLYNKDMTKLIYYPGGKTNSRFILPETVEVIGESAFAGNKYLTTVTIPNRSALSRIEENAFYQSGVTTITLPTVDLYADPLVWYQDGSFTPMGNINDVDASSIYEANAVKNNLLSGTVTISGTAQINATLTADFDGGNPNDALYYQWQYKALSNPQDYNGYHERDIAETYVNIGSYRMDNNFTLTDPNLIGKRIRCVVTKAGYQGEVVSQNTPAVNKYSHTSFEVTIPTVIDVDESSIYIDGEVVTIDGKAYYYEYSLDNVNWQDSVLFSNLESNKEYAVYRRLRETAVSMPSSSSAPYFVRTNLGDISGAFVFNDENGEETTTFKNGETITINAKGVAGIEGEALNYAWMRDDILLSNQTGSTYILTNDDAGSVITAIVTCEGMGGELEKDTEPILKGVNPYAAPEIDMSDIIATYNSVKISLTDMSYEYNLLIGDTETDWQCSPYFGGLEDYGADIKIFGAVRIKGNDYYEPSAAKEAPDGVYLENPPDNNYIKGMPAITGEVAYNETVTVDLSEVTYKDGSSVTKCKYEYFINGVDVTADANGNQITLDNADFIGQDLVVIVTDYEEKQVISPPYTINKGVDPVIPAKPVILEKTFESVTLEEVTPPEGRTVYYGLSTGSVLDWAHWQTSPVFTGLDEGAFYGAWIKYSETPLYQETISHYTAAYTYSLSDLAVIAVDVDSDSPTIGTTYTANLSDLDNLFIGAGPLAGSELNGYQIYSYRWFRENEAADIFEFIEGAKGENYTSYTATSDDLGYKIGYCIHMTFTVDGVAAEPASLFEGYGIAENYEDYDPVLRPYQTTPDAPVALNSNIGAAYIELEATEGYEYRINMGQWQDSPRFEGLIYDTYYTFTQRRKASEGEYPSGESPQAIFKTDTFEAEMLGAGTIDQPYLIESIEDLLAIGTGENGDGNDYSYTGKYYKLTANLDFEDDDDYENPDAIVTAEGDTLKESLTTKGSFEAICSEIGFSSVFDGDGYGLIHLNGTLFERIESGSVKNLGVIDVEITGKAPFAEEVADSGIVTDCYVTGILHGDIRGASGLVHTVSNDGEVANCYSVVFIDQELTLSTAGLFYRVREGASVTNNIALNPGILAQQGYIYDQTEDVTDSNYSYGVNDRSNMQTGNVTRISRDDVSNEQSAHYQTWNNAYWSFTEGNRPVLNNIGVYDDGTLFSTWGGPVELVFEGTDTVPRYNTDIFADLSGTTYDPSDDYQVFWGDYYEFTVGGLNEDSYHVAAEDIGKKIIARVANSNHYALTTSEFSDPVLKGESDSPSTPTVTNYGENHIWIELMDDDVEYSIDGGTNWQDSHIFQGLINNEEYSIIARIEESVYTYASEPSAPVTQRTEQSALDGIATYSGMLLIDETLMVNVDEIICYDVDELQYQWYADGEIIADAMESTYTITTDDIGKLIDCTITSSRESGSLNCSNAGTIVIAEPETYTVSFNMNYEDSGIEQVLVIDGNAVLEPDEPIRLGYTFGGWFVEETCDNPWDFQTKITVDTTIYAKWTVDNLIGTVLIQGVTQFDEVLTATVMEDANNTGDFSYQWIKVTGRGDNIIEEYIGGDSNTYTLVADDIGSQIKVSVSSSLQTGTIQSSLTAIITKASRLNRSPEAPVLISVGDTTVTVEYIEGLEYTIDGVTWQESGEFTGLEEASIYLIYCRMKEMDEYTVSGNSPAVQAITTGGYVEPTKEEMILYIKENYGARLGFAGYEIEYDANGDGILDIVDIVMIFKIEE